MWGSAVYRSAQFACMTYYMRRPSNTRHPWNTCRVQICNGGSWGQEPVGATARTVLESPIEYAKVKGQTNQKWRLQRGLPRRRAAVG